MSGDNILTQLASGDYYEAVRQRLPWIESTIPEARKVVEAMRRSAAYIETTVRVLEDVWGLKWHPYTDPPDDRRRVMLRVDQAGNHDCQGFYSTEFGAYAWSEQAAKRLRFVHPTHWRELTEEER